MTDDTPTPAPALLPMLWASMTFAQVVIVGLCFFLSAQHGVTLTFSMDRLLPGEGPGGVLFGLAFVMAVVAVAVPKQLAAMMPRDDSRSDIARAYTPFILHLALAESATLLGFVGAQYMTTPPVPERIVLPAAAGLVAALAGYPTANRIKELAQRR